MVISKFCSSGIIREVDRELYEYALNILLSTLSLFMICSIIGITLNMGKECLALFTSFLLIRKFAGGFHAPKAWQCSLLSIASIVAALFLIKWLLRQSDAYYYVALITPAPLIVMLSPVDTPQKPLNSKEKKLFKRISCTLYLVLASISLIFYLTLSKPIGLAIGMGLTLEAVILLSSLIQMLKDYYETFRTRRLTYETDRNVKSVNVKS